MFVKVYNEENVPDTVGTSLKGYINATYRELVNVLGEPTFDEPSADNKVQKEWVVRYDNKIFTIYDWKTFDAEYTEYDLDRFNVGGKESAIDFIDWLENEINNYQP